MNPESMDHYKNIQAAIKTLVTFHHAGWSTGILILADEKSLHDWVGFHPLLYIPI